jgi:5-methyltetrahydrofolate--homocysteine methyltransferase
MSQIEDIYQAVLAGDKEMTIEKIRAALSSGVAASDILQVGLIAAMGEVGRLFEEGDFFVPEMLIAAHAMQAGLEILKPMLVDAGVQPIGKVVIGTVRGDLHDIGKNLVAMMLEGAGFEILDLGTDVPAEKFLQAVKSSGADILALSALLTTTTPGMKTTIEILKLSGVGDHVKVMVGGAPVTEEYARQIGADGYAADASRAVYLAKSFIAKS